MIMKKIIDLCEEFYHFYETLFTNFLNFLLFETVGDVILFFQ